MSGSPSAVRVCPLLPTLPERLTLARAQQLDYVALLTLLLADEVQSLIDRLDAIPGVGRRVAEVLIAEVGTDMSRFPSAAHLASWAGMCPGNNESAGNRKSGRVRPGARAALVEAAHAAVRTKDTYLSAQFRRLAAVEQPRSRR